MAEGKGTYSGIFKMLGAAKAAADNRRVAASMGRVLSMSGRLRAGMLGMTSALAGTGAALVAVGMAARRVVNAYGEYTIAQSRIRTTLAAQLPNYRAVSAVVGQHADMVGRRLGYSLTESNEAMMTMLQTGLGTHRSMRVFGTAMQLARVADMDTANATRFLTDTMNMFRMEAARSGEEAQHFARRMSTQLAVAANMASTDIESLQQAFRYAGGELSTLGFESQDVMSALAALSSVGLRSTTAGTRLRGAIAALHTPSQTTLDFFEQFGIRGQELHEVFYDSTGQIRSMGDGMSNLGDLFRRLPSDFARNTAVTRLFGRRAMAAGSAISELSEAGDRFRAISARLGEEDVMEGTILDRQAQERTRSFGFQVEQLRQGITDLGIAFGEILFGAMDETGEGFGTHIRQVAAAIRLSGNLENMTAAQRREWEALSPEVRESGQRYRELFVNIAELIKFLGMLARGIMWLVNNFPRATLAAVGFYMVVGRGGLISAVSGAGQSLMTFSGHLLRNTLMMRHAGIGARLAMLAVAALGVEIAGRATTALQNHIIAQQGMTRELEQIRRGTVAAHAETVRSIPVVGHLAAQYVELAGAIQQAWREHDALTNRQEAAARREFGQAEEQIQRRYERMRESGLEQYRSRSDEELRAMAALQERQQSMVRMATLMYARGIQSERGVQQYLRGRVGAGQIAGISSEIMRLQRPMVARGEADVRREAARMTAGVSGWTEQSRMIRGMDQTATQLGGLESAAERARTALDEIALGIDAPGTRAEQSIPLVQDAYIGGSGLVRASAGDVIVSREHLARAVSARRGAMVGPAMGEGVGDRTMTGPMISSHGGGASEVTVEVPLVIDGTEIARAVGRAHIRHLERSGASFAPEQRRTMRETGFTERVG